MTAATAPPRGPRSAVQRNAVTVTGASAGPPLVFGHGFGCDQTMWHHVAPSFEATEQVVLLDHVGAGRSDLSAYDPRRHARLDGYAQDLVEVLDELDAGPVVFVGHSASAMIGCLAAADRPDLFDGLVLIGGSPRYLDDDDWTGGFSRADVDGLLEAMESNYLAWSQALAPAVMGNPDRPELADELAASFARTESRIAVEFARAIFLSDHRADLDRVGTPAVVVQPAEDPMVPGVVGERLHTMLRGSRLVRLGATGHFPHVSGPAETARVIRGFLDDLPGRGAP